MKDMLGNDLQSGDQVHVKVGNEWIVGTVLKIQDGGIAVGASARVQPGQQVPVTPDGLVLQIGIFFQTQPGMPHGDVARLDVSKKPTLVQ